MFGAIGKGLKKAGGAVKGVLGGGNQPPGKPAFGDDQLMASSAQIDPSGQFQQTGQINMPGYGGGGGDYGGGGGIGGNQGGFGSVFGGKNPMDITGKSRLMQALQRAMQQRGMSMRGDPNAPRTPFNKPGPNYTPYTGPPPVGEWGGLFSPEGSVPGHWGTGVPPPITGGTTPPPQRGGIGPSMGMNPPSRVGGAANKLKPYGV